MVIDDKWYKFDAEAALFDIAEMFPIKYSVEPLKYIKFFCSKRAEDEQVQMDDEEQENMTARGVHAFFIENKLCENIQSQICQKIENKLREITKLKF